MGRYRLPDIVSPCDRVLAIPWLKVETAWQHPDDDDSLSLEVRPTSREPKTVSVSQVQPGRPGAPLHPVERPARRTAGGRPPSSQPAWPGPRGAGRTTGSGSNR